MAWGGGPKRDRKLYITVKNDGGIEYVHRILAERALGHSLPAGAIVHHHTGSVASGFVICQDQAYHALLHRRIRILRAGGNPDTSKICACCKVVKPFEAFPSNRSTHDKLGSRCRRCISLNDYAKKKRQVAKAPRPSSGYANTETTARSARKPCTAERVAWCVSAAPGCCAYS